MVIDPVLAASDGTLLLERRAIPALCHLLGRATLATPNLREAGILTDTDVSTEEGVQAAACAIVTEMGAGAALVTGGDAEGPPRDLFAYREGGGVSLNWLEGERVDVGPVHGTGCALSSAITAALAQGEALRPAVESGRRFVADALRRAADRGALNRLLAY